MTLQQLEARARLMGETLHKMVKGDAGFVLFLMDFGVGGNMTYLANINREDMIVTIDDFVTSLKAKLVAEVVDPTGQVPTKLPEGRTVESHMRIALQDIHRLLDAPHSYRGSSSGLAVECRRRDVAKTIAQRALLGLDWDRVPM
jgi:hypothetical protein